LHDSFISRLNPKIWDRLNKDEQFPYDTHNGLNELFAAAKNYQDTMWELDNSIWAEIA
jgi:hypothetical protein